MAGVGATRVINVLVGVFIVHSDMRRWSYREFVQDRLNWSLIEDPATAEDRLVKIVSFAPRSVAVDFETTPSRIRLVQLGFDLPGYRPQQLVFDCARVPSALFIPLFTDRRVEKIIHFSQFEQGWCSSELGTVMEHVFDTCIAWRCIQTACAAHLRSGGRDRVEAVLPGYAKHGNALRDLTQQRLGFSLPKDEQVSNWGERRLREEQLVYAAMDVAVLPVITARTKPVLAAFGLERKVIHQTIGVAMRARQRQSE